MRSSLFFRHLSLQLLLYMVIFFIFFLSIKEKVDWNFSISFFNNFHLSEHAKFYIFFLRVCYVHTWPFRLPHYTHWFDLHIYLLEVIKIGLFMVWMCITKYPPLLFILLLIFIKFLFFWTRLLNIICSQYFLSGFNFFSFSALKQV